MSSVEHVGTKRGVITGSAGGPSGAQSMHLPPSTTLTAEGSEEAAACSIEETNRSVSARDTLVLSPGKAPHTSSRGALAQASRAQANVAATLWVRAVGEAMRRNGDVRRCGAMCGGAMRCGVV